MGGFGFQMVPDSDSPWEKPTVKNDKVATRETQEDCVTQMGYVSRKKGNFPNCIMKFDD